MAARGRGRKTVEFRGVNERAVFTRLLGAGLPGHIETFAVVRPGDAVRQLAAFHFLGEAIGIAAVAAGGENDSRGLNGEFAPVGLLGDDGRYVAVLILSKVIGAGLKQKFAAELAECVIHILECTGIVDIAMVNAPADRIGVLALLRIPVDKFKLGAVLIHPVDGRRGFIDDAAGDRGRAQVVVVIHELLVELVLRELRKQFRIVLVLGFLHGGFNGKEPGGELAGTAHCRSLFKHDDLGACFSGGDGGGSARSARADHHDVGRQGLIGADGLSNLHVVLFRISAGLLDRRSHRLADGFARHRSAAHAVDSRGLMLNNGRRHFLGSSAAEFRGFAGNVKLNVGDAAVLIERDGSLDG